MLFRWSLKGDELVELFLHLFADFGTASVWNIDFIDDEIAVLPLDSQVVPTSRHMLTSEQVQCIHSTFTPFAQTCKAECTLITCGILTSPHSKLLTPQVHGRWSSFADDSSQRIELGMTLINQPVHASTFGARHSVAKAAAPILLRLKGGGRSKEKGEGQQLDTSPFDRRQWHSCSRWRVLDAREHAW